MSRNRWAQGSGAWISVGGHKAQRKGGLGPSVVCSAVGPFCPVQTQCLTPLGFSFSTVLHRPLS